MRVVVPVTVVPRKRRGVELALVIFALALTLGAYALVDINVTGQVSSSFPYVAGVCILLAALAHIAVRWRLPYADPVILPCVILLNGLGLVMIHRIDLINDPPLNGARQQLIWTAVGVLFFILVVAWLNDHRPLQRFTYTIGLAGIVLLLLPLLPGLGTEKFGAQIWIQVGPYSFQPAEAAKVLLAIAFASYLVEKREVLALAGWRVLGIDLPRARDLGPILIIWLISLAVLVWQRDLGTSLLFFGLFVMMLYVSTERAGWVVLGTLLFAAGAATASMFPSLTLNASYGHGGFDWSTFTSPQGVIWSVAGSVTQPLFHGGALFARRRQYLANYEAAVGQYKQTVLSAFRNVADTLVSLDEDANTLTQTQRAESAAHETSSDTEARYKLGATPYYATLTAGQQYQNARVQVARARASRLADTAALFDSMGNP